MLGMVRDNTLYFRVDDDNRAAFQEAESFPPLNYEKKGGTIDLSFWRAQERLFDEPDEFVTWGRAASSTGGCAPGRGEATTVSAKAKIKPSTNEPVAMKFGIHNSTWLDNPDPVEASETVKAKAQWARTAT
jgi:TfoX N-terminal domain